MTEFPTPVPGNCDAAAGQPAWPAAVHAWQLAAGQAWADPGRRHSAGQRSLQVLHAARVGVATILGTRSDVVHFAPSGVTAVQAAVHGVLDVAGLGRGTLLIGAIEPLAAFDVADRHERAGGTVRVLGVDGSGRIDVRALDDALGSDVVGVVVQAANAEVGTRQPLDAIHARCQAAGVPLIVDASQVLGHDPAPDDWDVLIGHARDWASPIPIGIVAVRTPRWRAPYGSQHGWLGGVADVSAAASAVTALEAAMSIRAEQAAAHVEQIDALRSVLRTSIADVDVVGDPVNRLPHVLTFSVLYCAGDALVSELNRLGFAVASGSACVVDSDRASHVLAAMGAFTGGNVRITLPYGSTMETIDGLCAALTMAIDHVREEI